MSRPQGTETETGLETLCPHLGTALSCPDLRGRSEPGSATRELCPAPSQGSCPSEQDPGLSPVQRPSPERVHWSQGFGLEVSWHRAQAPQGITPGWGCSKPWIPASLHPFPSTSTRGLCSWDWEGSATCKCHNFKHSDPKEWSGDKVGISQGLGSVVLEVFSNLNNSVIPWIFGTLNLLWHTTVPRAGQGRLLVGHLLWLDKIQQGSVAQTRTSPCCPVPPPGMFTLRRARTHCPCVPCHW